MIDTKTLVSLLNKSNELLYRAYVNVPITRLGNALAKDIMAHVTYVTEVVTEVTNDAQPEVEKDTQK